MSVRNIMWTALPNGVAAAGDRLHLSVLVSPRLVTDGVSGTLAQFPDFEDWPSVVGGLSFTIEFQGGPSFQATPVVAQGFPTLDSTAWKALFPADTFVRSYAFDDRSSLAVRSFPTKKVLSFLTGAYQTTAIQSPHDKPTLRELGFGREGAQFETPFNRVAIYGDEQPGLERTIEAVLRQSKAVPADFGTPKTDLLQVRLMHQSLSKEVKDANNHRVPLPPQTLPEVDFHKAVASMGQYPKLMRALGLAIDLEVPVDGVPAASNVRVTPDLPGPVPMTPWTAYRLDPTTKHFMTAPDADSDVTDGMLLFSGTDQYDIVEMDVDGAAEKVLDFTFNLSRLGFGDARSSIDTPDRYGLPSLQSAGFSAARVDRAMRLVNVFQGAKGNNNAITTNPQGLTVVLHAEDVTRGYRVDVWDSMSGEWHSLCLRDGVYNFLNGPLTRKFADEGFVTVATSQSADGTSSDLRLPESLFRWAGWSLSAPRAGKTIGSDSTPASPANPATTDIKLETSFTAQKGTLPRLRFGAQYQFRARAVDLAGNSHPSAAVLDEVYNLPPQPIRYLRYEPVVAPAVVLRHPLDPNTTPGESGDRIVIRSNFDTHIAVVSERHIAPPKTSQIMAETHGMLDTAAGPPDKARYSLLVNRDGSFNSDPAHPDQPVPHPEAQLTLPYLPDPFAPGAAFLGLPGTTPDKYWHTPFSGEWPDPKPFRFVLDEGTGAPELTENATERVLRVHLPKAEVVTVPLSCFLTDDITTQPPSMLSTMKIWKWIEEMNPPNLAGLRDLALKGGHWMLTPPRLLTLVHAVQQPLLEPQFQGLKAGKVLGTTYATITDEFPISGKSTIKVDIEAEWHEPVDDLSDDPQPVDRHGKSRAFEVPVNVDESVLAIDDSQGGTKHFSSKHEFHDTKHRRVTYTAKATTRFKEYFPDAFTAIESNITRTSQPVTVSVLNSARPAAPKPLYVIPAFGWETVSEGAWNFSKRSGGLLRVYLDRPWYSSGEGELLGAVLWGCAPPRRQAFQAWEVPDFLKGYVTQWGKDPIWNAPAPPSQAMPMPEHFLNAATIGQELTLDELSNGPFIPFSVAGHVVEYDNARKLWYCDIAIDPGKAYFPFVRLALARYQPESVADAHLSRVVLADFAQLMPGRSASITFDPIETTSLQVAITGMTHSNPDTTVTSVMTATLQTQAAGAGDVAWTPLSVTPLTPYVFGGPDTLWTASITLPAPRGSKPFRLLIEEFEVYRRDVDGRRQRRLVYADILSV